METDASRRGEEVRRAPPEEMGGGKARTGRSPLRGDASAQTAYRSNGYSYFIMNTSPIPSCSR